MDTTSIDQSMSTNVINSNHTLGYWIICILSLLLGLGKYLVDWYLTSSLLLQLQLTLVWLSLLLLWLLLDLRWNAILCPQLKIYCFVPQHLLTVEVNIVRVHSQDMPQSTTFVGLKIALLTTQPKNLAIKKRINWYLYGNTPACVGVAPSSFVGRVLYLIDLTSQHMNWLDFWHG